MEERPWLRITRAFGTILVLVAYLLLTVAHLANMIRFPVSERLLLLSIAASLLGTEGLVKIFVGAIKRINLSIERDTGDTDE